MHGIKSIFTVGILVIWLLSACSQSKPQQSGPTLIKVGTVAGTTTENPPVEISPTLPTHIIPTSNLEATPDGGRIITRADQGKTISVNSGDSFLLELGDEYSWEVNLSDQNVINRVKNIAVIRGAQGVFRAIQPGTVSLSAAGDPTCRQSQPPCGMPSLMFVVIIVVK